MNGVEVLIVAVICYALAVLADVIFGKKEDRPPDWYERNGHV